MDRLLGAIIGPKAGDLQANRAHAQRRRLSSKDPPFSPGEARLLESFRLDSGALYWHRNLPRGDKKACSVETNKFCERPQAAVTKHVFLKVRYLVPATCTERGTGN